MERALLRSCPEQRRPELKPDPAPASPGSVASESGSTELPARLPLLLLQACFPSPPSQSKDLEQTAVSRSFRHPLPRLGGDLIWLSVPRLIRDQSCNLRDLSWGPWAPILSLVVFPLSSHISVFSNCCAGALSPQSGHDKCRWNT